MVCQSSFEESPEIGRSNRKFCSNACRSKLYRKRQTRARVLHNSGRSLQAIASKLRTDMKTVKRWLSDEEG
jgi:hypothetical protein